MTVYRHKIKDDDRKFKKILKEIKKNAANPKAVVAGVIGSKGGDRVDPETGATVAEYAAFNEYGTDRIPSRPFMRRASYRFGKRKWVGTAAKMAGGLGTVYTVEHILNTVGLIMVADIQHVITALRTPPNAEATIQRKGSSNPLIDTGRMRQSINYDIRGLKDDR